jgi:SAM-dependent methyltransferase
LSALRRALPERVKPPLRFLANAVDPVVRVGSRARRNGAIPPRRLRASVGQPSSARYLAEGETVAGELTELLAEHGRALGEFHSICDLASGPGKVLARLDPSPGSALAAIDVNAESIEWLKRTLPEVDARAERPLPPTSFADGSFDLVVAISLFTHLPQDSQLAWLGEVGRLLSDDGLALLTVHGDTAYEGFRTARRPGITPAQVSSLSARGPLAAEGFVFEPEQNPGSRSPGVEADWGLAFHSHDYIRERWGQLLEIERILPAAINFRQDAVFVRRRSASR